MPKILLFAKTFQKGRGTQNVPNGTKNELEVNTFDFTEGWFRNSGLYELNAENQMIFMTWFIEDQKILPAVESATVVIATRDKSLKSRPRIRARGMLFYPST